MPYDYSKINKWTTGAPDKLEVGMVLETNEGYDFVGTIHKGGCWRCNGCICYDIEPRIIRWAWHPGFEPEGE